MKIRKTSSKKRTTYTYVDAEGNKTVLRPGENGVTEFHIKKLHAADDAEVYNNLKNAHPGMTNEEKEKCVEWEKLHPGEKAPANWNLSIDATLTDEADSATLGDMICTPKESEDPMVELLRDVAETLTERQKQVYILHLLRRYSVKETAKIMGISEPAVTKHKKKIIEIIKKAFEGVNF